MPQRYIISKVSNATLKMNNDNNINTVAIKARVGCALYIDLLCLCHELLLF